MHPPFSSPPWSRLTKYVVLALSFAALLALMRFAAPLFGPLAIAALLAFILAPLTERLAAHRRISRDSAALIVYLIFLVLLIALPSLVVPALIRQVLNLSIDLLAAERAIEEFARQPVSLGVAELTPAIPLTRAIEDALQGFINRVSSGAFNLLGEVSSNLAWLLVVLVTTYYFLKDGGKLLDWLVGWLPQSHHGDARAFIAEMNRIWGVFLRGQIILALIIAAMTSLAMAAVGLRGAVGIGMLAGALDVIPSVGPMVGGFVAVMVALIFGSSYLEISAPVFGLTVGFIFLVIQQIENIWLRPRIMGQNLRMHPALIFVGVIGALALSGVLAALVVIPLMATAGELGRYIYFKIAQTENPPASQTEEAGG